MYKVKIMNEFLHGAICVYEDDVPSSYELIDTDLELSNLNELTEELYNSFYEFDSHDQPVWFNTELEKQFKCQMLELIKKIIDRLAEINDGSFIVEDYETDKIRSYRC